MALVRNGPSPSSHTHWRFEFSGGCQRVWVGADGVCSWISGCKGWFWLSLVVVCGGGGSAWTAWVGRGDSWLTVSMSCWTASIKLCIVGCGGGGPSC